MKTLPSFFIARLFWIILLGGVGVSLTLQGFAEHLLGVFLSGIGMVLLGVGGFLHPIPFNSPITKTFAVSPETAMGPAALRSANSLAALACLVGGFLLRYVFQV